MMLSATTLDELAREELTQLREEGCDVAALRARFDQLEGAEAALVQAALSDWFEVASRLRPLPDFPYHEPSDLDGIRAARPDTDRWSVQIGEEKLRDRLTGAWFGRCIGCMMGKPVEGESREAIEKVLRVADAYPLDGYFRVVEEIPEGVTYRPPSSPCLVPNITRSVTDDDTDYAVLGLLLVERHGADLAPAHVMTEWLTRMPYLHTFSAERVAIRNFTWEIEPPASATYINPYREWIGAQIRADGFAYCAAGRPELAADLCWRDACISHTKNGIYGEMFFGALIAAASGADDLHAAIERALGEIPANCRLAEAIRECVAWCAEDETWEQTWDRVMEKYGHYHRIHTIINALFCMIGLLHGEGDMRRAITIAIMAGHDTDCNGATVGSVMGALLGADAVPADLAAPLNNTLETSLSGLTEMRISDLIERSLVAARSMPEG